MVQRGGLAKVEFQWNFVVEEFRKRYYNDITMLLEWYYNSITLVLVWLQIGASEILGKFCLA